MRIRRFGTILTSTAIVAIAAVTGAGAVGQNLSFEEGAPVNAGAFRFVPGGDTTAITGWEVGGHSVDIIRGYWESSHGERNIDLNGTGAGSLSQTFPTSVGEAYLVTFDLSANPEGGPAVKTLNVYATGAGASAYAYDGVAMANTKADMKWVTRTYLFVATADATTLTFESTTFTASGTGNFFGPALDNVRIDEVGTEVCKKGGWMNLTDASGRSFKNQGDCVSYIATDGRNGAAGD
jgi:choice-of-anchor C domain-containing protein